MIPRTDISYSAVRRGHTYLARAELWTPDGHVADVPIHGGSVTKSLTDGQGQWSGELRVPGYQWFDLLAPGTYCWVEVHIRVDEEEWPIGQFPVLTVAEDRPGGLITATLGDWAYRRDRADAETAFAIPAGVSVAETVRVYMAPVLPALATTVARDDSNGALVVSEVKAQVGGSVWGALTQIANQVGCTAEVPTRGTVAIRRYDPYVPYHEDITGTVVRMRTTVDAARAVNMVRQVLEPSDPAGTTYMADKLITWPPYAYDRTKFGLGVVAQATRVDTPTQAMADTEAQRVFDRQAGLVKRLELTVLPQPWLECGDVLFLRVGDPLDNRIEQTMINSITHPLTADQSMTIRTRDVQVLG